jgi:hypothetical protein
MSSVMRKFTDALLNILENGGDWDEYDVIKFEKDGKVTSVSSKANTAGRPENTNKTTTFSIITDGDGEGV